MTLKYIVLLKTQYNDFTITIIPLCVVPVHKVIVEFSRYSRNNDLQIVLGPNLLIIENI